MPRKRQRALDAYLGARLRLRRLMLGLSQEALGAKLALTFQQVQKYEKGANRISASRLYELAHVLDVPVSYFYEGLDDEGNPAEYEGLQEEAVTTGDDVSPYLEFVSSSDGVQLNKAFLDIADIRLRRQVLGVMTNLARIAADAAK